MKGRRREAQRSCLKSGERGFSLTFQGKSAAHLSAGFGARAAVYFVAALFFVGSVQSLVTLYRLFLLGVFASYLTPWQAWLLVYPGLLIVMAVGLPLLKKWAWALAIVLSLISGIMGLVALFRLEEMPWVAVLNTPSRVAWWGVSAVADLGVVVVLLLKPVRALFFRRPPPPAAVLNRSGV